MTPFPAGATILLREVLHGAVWLQLPATVVADDGDVLAVLVVPGAPFTFPPHPFGEHPWSGRSAWRGTTVLRLYRRGLHYSVWRLFTDGAADGWYVNFERPIVRGDNCVDIDDWGLDIVVAADGSWEWKDLDDPPAMVERGRLTSVELDELRGAADELATSLDTGNTRWWETWTDWRPPPPSDVTDR